MSKEKFIKKLYGIHHGKPAISDIDEKIKEVKVSIEYSNCEEFETVAKSITFHLYKDMHPPFYTECIDLRCSDAYDFTNELIDFLNSKDSTKMFTKVCMGKTKETNNEHCRIKAHFTLEKKY